MKMYSLREFIRMSHDVSAFEQRRSFRNEFSDRRRSILRLIIFNYIQSYLLYR